MPQWRRHGFGERQRHIFDFEFPSHEASQFLTEECTGRYAANVVAADGECVACQPVEPGYRIVGGADPPKPCMLELDVFQLREQPGHGAPCPVMVNAPANALERTDTAEYESSVPIEARRG